MMGHVYAKLFGEEAAAVDGEALCSELMKYKDGDYPSQWMCSLPSAKNRDLACHGLLACLLQHHDLSRL